jgi:hypothetical protein
LQGIATIALIAMMVQPALARAPEGPSRQAHERWLVVRALAFNFALVPLMALLAEHALSATASGAFARYCRRRRRADGMRRC